MFAGTGSDVGKSVINAAFCRILKQDGYQPAPFKAQNMSLNSYATPDGLEIGRAQAMQAEACGIDCMVEMNPVLLKPMDNQTAQVVLNGKPTGNKSAGEYFNDTNRDALFDEVMQSYTFLANKYNPVVIEGAGSISELNLRSRDITNMRVAIAAGAATFLVADIDRGGVFASVYGTIMLLTPEERKQMKGIIINKFRGDISLFYDGRKTIEELTGLPVIAIIPWFRDIILDDEDAVVLGNKPFSTVANKANVAVVLLPHMANFTDFNALEHHPEIHMVYASKPEQLTTADIIVLPGSKNTIADLQYLRENGMAKAILNEQKLGKCIYGICGGYQMMGKTITDPKGIEGDIAVYPGLGLLPVATEMEEGKTTVQTTFRFKQHSEICYGYEIHAGKTTWNEPSPLNTLNDTDEGYCVNDKLWGTYMHGLFDNDVVINDILAACGHNGSTKNRKTMAEFKNEQYDKLAEHVRCHTDMNLFYNALKK